jgi:hypothetical protein
MSISKRIKVQKILFFFQREKILVETIWFRTCEFFFRFLFFRAKGGPRMYSFFPQTLDKQVHERWLQQCRHKRTKERALLRVRFQSATSSSSQRPSSSSSSSLLSSKYFHTHGDRVEAFWVLLQKKICINPDVLSKSDLIKREYVHFCQHFIMSSIRTHLCKKTLVEKKQKQPCEIALADKMVSESSFMNLVRFHSNALRNWENSNSKIGLWSTLNFFRTCFFFHYRRICGTH